MTVSPHYLSLLLLFLSQGQILPVSEKIIKQQDFINKIIILYIINHVNKMRDHSGSVVWGQIINNSARMHTIDQN